MTIHYAPEMATTGYTRFLRVMLKWKGSLWKLIYMDVIVWCVLYAAISAIYRTVLHGQSKRTFESIVQLCYETNSWIPLAFIVQAFVSLVLSRWWSVVSNIGFIDNLALVVANYVRGKDERAVLFKRNIIRHMTLLQAMVYRNISPSVKRKYPSLESLVQAGYLEPEEVSRFSENNFYQSVSWALALARNARDEGIIKSDPALQDIFRICTDFRWSQITLFYFNWIPVPLAFSQIISLVVRCYFILALIGRQFTRGEDRISPIDIYVPVITLMQLILYAGWVKVAETLINPCGDDDEDFDFEWFLARNMRQAKAIASDENSEPPPLCWDKFWREQQERDIKEKTTVKWNNAEFEHVSSQILHITVTSDQQKEAESIVSSTDSGRHSGRSCTSMASVTAIQINQ